jgi:hypothetical protein
VPVLFVSTLTGAAVWVGLLVVQMLHLGTLPAGCFYLVKKWAAKLPAVIGILVGIVLMVAG